MAAPCDQIVVYELLEPWVNAQQQRCLRLVGLLSGGLECIQKDPQCLNRLACCLGAFLICGVVQRQLEIGRESVDRSQYLLAALKTLEC